MKLMSILILEGRKEDLKKKYSDKFDEETLNWILNISDLVDFNHKYTDFLLKVVDPEIDASPEYIENIIDYLKLFDKYQSQFPKKDINQYVSFIELESVVNHVIKKHKEKELEKKVNKIYEDNKFLVVKPETEEASCKYGSNTKWCVTSKGTGHFERYTKGAQGLYFIINKTNSTNKNYSKVAVHFDNAGKPHFWDSQDSLMNERESEILKYAFPELIEAINQDYNKFKMGALDRLLIETFNQVGENSSEKKNYLNSKNDLSVYFRGFRNTPNRAEGLLSISLFTPEGNKLIDQYRVFIKYKSKNNEQFTASVSFVGEEDYLENFQDFELDGWGIDTTYLIMRTPAETAEGVRRHISQRVLDHIQDNPKLMKMVAGTSNVWRPDRFNYGYTFGKNKGLIKKLVNYLEKGEIGTKLDFLESIGKLKTKVIDGKKLYSHSYSDKFFPSSQFRGQFSSFFASAKLAGILGYRKIGKDYFLVKGPNFEAFKSGKLKAL